MVEYGLIGRGISHSFSAAYFNEKFKKENIEAIYIPLDLEKIDNLHGLIESHPNLKGLNVTSPYKRDVIPFLDSLSEEARLLEAVNVIKISKCGGKTILEGYNTDCPGFGETIELLKGNGIKALVMGTGGAASAVSLALKKADIQYKIVSRNPVGNQIGYNDMKEYLPTHHLLINATPIGMYPHTECCPAVDFSYISPYHICYDLIYNPSETVFLRKSIEKGATVVNGLKMLLNQAELSWKIWAS